MSEVVVNVLKEDNTPKTPEELVAECASIAEEGNTPVMPGSSTHPTVLLKSIQQERDKVTRLETELEALQNSHTGPSSSSADITALQEEIKSATQKIDGLLSENTRKDILLTYPVIVERQKEFDEFLADPENKGMSLKTAARAFLAENGLLDQTRKGLEKGTGGERSAAPSQKMSMEDIKELREKNPKKYEEMLMAGSLPF